jgi:hypothetical protein
VLAVQGDAVSVLAQVVVAPRSTVAADDVDYAVGMAEASHEIVQKIEFMDIVSFYVSGAMIAQEMIELRDSVRQILVSDAIHDVDVFTSVKVIEAEPVLFGRG